VNYIDWLCVGAAASLVVKIAFDVRDGFRKTGKAETDDEPSRDTNPVRSLTGRIVLCANCDEKATLYTSSSGSVVCSVCGSPSWMFELPKLVRRLVDEEKEIRQLEYIYCVMPNDLPIGLRAQWVDDAKRRAEERVERAHRRDAETQRGGAV